MSHKTKITIRIILVILAIILIYYSVWFFKFAKHYPRNIDLIAKKDYWGLTFSKKFSSELGLDWRENYISILDDLQVKYIRIPIYWDEVESQKGEYSFSDYDYIFDEGAKRNVKFIANVGHRLPRWPECHAPKFTKFQKDVENKLALLNYIEAGIERYKDRPEIVAWQVENEPLLNSFGICPDGDEEFLRQEVALVKKLDNRPVIISASGEISTWKKEGKIGDIFGTTMYRIVWNPMFGYFKYSTPSWFYKLKGRLVDIPKDKMIISELQTEPWVPKGTLADIPFEESSKSFNIDQFRANLQYAIDADLNQAYLWGVEWWYFEYKNGNKEYWELAKTLFNK